MGARLYDEAIANKINKWIKDPNLKVRILKPNEVSRFLQMQLDEGKDHITLPQITLSRQGYRILNTNKQVKSFDGVTIRVYDKKGNLINKGNAMKLNAIPIELEYKLDIYTLDMEDADEYVRNFVFNFINYPQDSVVIPYNNTNVTHKFNIYLDEQVEDNSDIPERLFPTQFVRYTLTLMVDDAYLFSIPVKDNVEITTADVVLRDNPTGSDYEDISIEFEK